ncbi:MAG: hypothetical protein R6W90_18805 [Ignavibacteriaceae bacterium]
MKKILFVLLVSFITVHAQENTTKNLLTLKSEFKSGSNADSELNLQPQTDFKKKSPGLAIIYSLLLPGMGELYAESYSTGKYFTIAEGALWGVYIGMNTYGNWQKDKYISYAASNGGVNTTGKNDEYYNSIGQYENINEYNHQMSLDREFRKILDEDTHSWQWAEEDRRSYRNMWVTSEEAFNNLRFVVGALLLNRLASAVNAVRLVSAYNKRAAAEMSWNVSVGVINQVNVPSGLSLNFQTSF